MKRTREEDEEEEEKEEQVREEMEMKKATTKRHKYNIVLTYLLASHPEKALLWQLFVFLRSPESSGLQ